MKISDHDNRQLLELLDSTSRDMAKATPEAVWTAFELLAYLCGKIIYENANIKDSQP